MPGETVILRPETAGGVQTTPRISAELHETVAERIALFATVVGACVTFALALNFFVTDVLGWPRIPNETQAHASELALIGLSFAIAVMSRFRLVAPRTIVHVGLVYEVVGALLVTMGAWFAQSLIQEQMLSISWVCVWIVMFPLIVPATPARNIIASFASASMGPLCIAYCVHAGAPRPPLSKLVASFLPGYMAAGMAIVPAFLMYRLGRSLSVAEKKLKELGSYQLIELLGRGGMGEVWRAEHRMLARPAAVKIVQLDAEDETPEARLRMLRRFEVEARATASLHSPHTVSLYDFGTTQDGTFYYVMELLTGLDLESLVKRFGPLPAGRAVHLLRQICKSLAEAHAAGMVHRDIKPANIYLCRLGLEHDWVKVLDFGLVAKAKGCTSCSKDPNASRLTAVNTIVGTPSFMPPEMAEGRPDIDGRADLYALGCVAYWLLTGTLLFDGPDKTPMKVLMDHVGTAPEPPSKRVGAPVHAGLERLVLKLLEKDPRDRPPSAAEVERLLAELELDAWAEADARRWWDEHLHDLAAEPVGEGRTALASTVVKPVAVA